MPDILKRIFDPVVNKWKSLNNKQRLSMGAVGLGIIIAISVTLFLALRPNWIMLINDRNWIEIAQMQAALDAQGIRNRPNALQNGIYVDYSQRFAARTVITLEELSPREDHFTWPDALDTGIGTTDSERRQMAILATEGDIARMIEATQGINRAIVNVNAPIVRPFDQTAPPPTAVIQVSTSRSFTADEGRNFALMAAHSINGLTLENVVVFDQNARTLFNGSNDLNNDPGSIAQDAQNQHTMQTEWNLNRMFSFLFDEVVATANFAFDARQYNERISEVFSVPDGMEGTGIPFANRELRSQFEGRTGGAAPGLGANDLTPPIGYAIGNEGLTTGSQREIDQQLAINRTQEIERAGQGWVIPEESSVSITAHRLQDVSQELWMAEDSTRTQQDWDRHKQANANFWSINSTFGEFEHVRESAAAVAGIPIERVVLNIWEGYNFIDTIPSETDIPLIVALIILALLLLMFAYGLLLRPRIIANEEEEAEPELSVEDLLVTTQLEEEKDEEARQLEEIDYFKENEIKRHIEKFVNEKPEAVAALLRNWINIEEW